jgi:hypothetical protein
VVMIPGEHKKDRNNSWWHHHDPLRCNRIGMNLAIAVRSNSTLFLLGVAI